MAKKEVVNPFELITSDEWIEVLKKTIDHTEYMRDQLPRLYLALRQAEYPELDWTTYSKETLGE